MAYGDGGNWSGTAKVIGHLQVVIWETRFEGSSASVSFPVTDGQSAKAVAKNLVNAWNATSPNEATIINTSTVTFKKNGQGPEAMAVTGAYGRKEVPEGGEVQVVDGLKVKNV